MHLSPTHNQHQRCPGMPIRTVIVDGGGAAPAGYQTRPIADSGLFSGFGLLLGFVLCELGGLGLCDALIGGTLLGGLLAPL